MQKLTRLTLAAATAGLVLTAASANAALTSQLGILDLTANGGINPATGVDWEAGDTYRLAFVTSGTILGTSTSIATYNAFVNKEDPTEEGTCETLTTARSASEPNGFTHTSPGQDRPSSHRPGSGVEKHIAG